MSAPEPERRDPETGERLQRGHLTRAELRKYLADMRDGWIEDNKKPRPVQVLDRPCNRCRGVGFVDVRWVGWIRCGQCNTTGSAVVVRAKAINSAREKAES